MNWTFPTEIISKQITYECSITSSDLRVMAIVTFIFYTFFLLFEKEIQTKPDIYQWMKFINYMFVCTILGLLVFNN